MKRTIVLIAGVGAALLVVAAGVSAHSGLLVKFVGVSHSQFGTEASGARLESPEPTDSPEASPTSEPTEKPEASPAAEPAEAPEASATETNDADTPKNGTTSTTNGGDHKGDSQTSGGD